MFECDVKLSADGMPFLMHDSTLERTTNGRGTAGQQAWAELAVLDAGSWHSNAFVGEKIPRLELVAEVCMANGWLLNIEIKPTPGSEFLTGAVVANTAAKLWADSAIPPLLSSFQPLALQAAQDMQPHLPRGLLLDTLPAHWLQTAQQLACHAVICQHELWTNATVAQAQSACFKTLTYTVNDTASLLRLQALDIDGFITDRVDSFGPRS